MTEHSTTSPSDPVADARAVRRFAMSLMIVASAAMSFAQVVQSQPLQSANDRSRWATVWSLVERRTYQIDEIDAVSSWSTIDKVRHDGHFYSSKPPLQSTVVAGVYWCVKGMTGWNLSQNTTEAARAILLIVSWLPSVLSLIVLARLLERYATTDFGRLFIMAVACWGTLLNPFVSSLNNHSPAAVCLMLATYSLLRILIDGERCWRRFVVCGLFASATFALELPAAIVVVAFGLLLLRIDRRRTLTRFLPAALVPIIAYAITNWLATGQSLPFYSSYGTSKYLYEHEGVPSYWMNPQGLDRNLDSPLMYFVHCTIGHHGLLSLTPVWLLTLVGWLTWRRWREHRLANLLLVSAGMTLIVLGFYLTRTQNYNYGGNSVALRWMLWLSPLWLIGMIPLFDGWGSRRGFQINSAILLAASVVSASLPGSNPWQSNWLYSLMQRRNWVNYETSPPPFAFQHKLWSWFPKLGDENKLGPSYVLFQGTGSRLMGTEWPDDFVGEYSLTLETVVRPDHRTSQPGNIGLTFVWSGDQDRGSIFHLDAAAFHAGKKFHEFLRTSSGSALKGQELLTAQRLITGLPQSVEYRPGVIRYLTTPLRPEKAFRCQRAAAQTYFQPTHAKHPLRYRCDVWLCEEIPFGVAQLDLTISDPDSGQTLSFQRLIATEATGFEH